MQGPCYTLAGKRERERESRGWSGEMKLVHQRNQLGSGAWSSWLYWGVHFKNGPCVTFYQMAQEVGPGSGSSTTEVHVSWKDLSSFSQREPPPRRASSDTISLHPPSHAVSRASARVGDNRRRGHMTLERVRSF